MVGGRERERRMHALISLLGDHDLEELEIGHLAPRRRKLRPKRRLELFTPRAGLESAGRCRTQPCLESDLARQIAESALARRAGAQDGARASRWPRREQGSLGGMHGIARPSQLARHLRLQRLEHAPQSRSQIADGTLLLLDRAELGTQPFEDTVGREPLGGSCERRGGRARCGGCVFGLGAHGSAWWRGRSRLRCRRVGRRRRVGRSGARHVVVRVTLGVHTAQMHRPISDDEIGLTNQQRHVGAELGGSLAPFTHEGSSRRLERLDRRGHLELHLHREILGIRDGEVAIWPVEHQASTVLAHGADHRVALHLAQQIQLHHLARQI